MAEIIPHEYVDAVPLSKLKPHPANPNQGDVGAISQSLDAVGFYGAVLAQKSTGRILAGHHRVKAAKGAKLDALPVIYLDVDDAQALAILVGDNGIAKQATWNDDLLAATLVEVKNSGLLQATGFDGDDIDRLLAEANANFAPLDEGEGARLDQKNAVECPNCGESFHPA